MRTPSILVFLLSLLISLLPLTQAECTGRQPYVLSLSLDFTRSKDPTLPDKRSIPLLVAVVHRSNYVLFRPTDKVDDEVAEVALHWSAHQLKEQLDRLQDSGIVSSYTIEEDLDIDGTTRFELSADDGATKLSFIAPLVPSPAWFVGVSSFDLCPNGVFVPKNDSIEVESYDSGLTNGRSWTADYESFEEGKRLPVGGLANLDDIRFARLDLEQGTLGVDWWKIFLGVVVGVAVLVILAMFVLPRLRRRKQAEIPLTAPDGVQW